MSIISYAHRGEPNGIRFHQVETDKLPEWAVNIRAEDASTNAWAATNYGLPYHPTDTYVHWQDKDPVSKMNEMRALYDKILTVGGLPKEIAKLLDFAYDAGQADQADGPLY